MAIQSKQLPNGETRYTVYVQSHNVHGQRIQKKRSGIKSLRAARETETLLRAQLMVEKGKPSRLTWGMWFTQFLAQLKLVSRPSTVENYETVLGKWVTPVLRDRFLDELTTVEIHQILTERVHGITESSRRHLLDLIKRVLNSALEQGVISKNPALPLKIKVPQNRLAVLNASEAQILLEEAKALNHRFYVIWATALFTGMRSGELYALKWTDVDFENSKLYVSRSWCSKAGYGPTKSQKNRIVPISSQLRQLLVELKVKADTEFVLPHLTEWTSGMQARVLADFCRLTKITAIRFHDLRATFITQLLLRGVPLAQVMSIVGHSELRTTNAYLRVAGTDLEGATEALTYSLPQAKLAEVIEFARKA